MMRDLRVSFDLCRSEEEFLAHVGKDAFTHLIYRYDFGHEIVVQNLQRETLRDNSVPANQKAQTSNAVAATLATLSKLQTEMYTSERLKKIEQVLIETLQTLPQETQAAFLDTYEANLAAAKL